MSLPEGTFSPPTVSLSISRNRDFKTFKNFLYKVLKVDIAFFVSIDRPFQCTATCGVGMQMRNVYCATREGPKMLRILTTNQCANETKIKGMQMCSVRPCQAGWYIHPWEPVRVLRDYSYIRSQLRKSWIALSSE